MKLVRHALASGAALSLVLAANPAIARDHHAATEAASEMSEHDKLFALFADADERSLKLNPVGALFRGDMRYADRLGDYLTDEHLAASKADNAENLAKLAEIDRSKLSPTDQLAYDVFAYNQQREQEGYAPAILAASEVRPVNHFSGFHTFYPNFASGQSAAPFKTVEDYENNLKRHEDYIAITDRAIGKFREGMETGVYETKLTIGNVVSQLDTQLAMPVEESPFFMPVKNFPEEFSAEEKARLTAEYTAATEEIYAAHERMRDFLRDEYMAVARDSVGLSQMKGGAELYRHMVEGTTTLPLEPDYLHELGLSEVARIKNGLEQIKQEVGFEGTLNEFFDYVRTDEQFKPESREALTQSYYDIGEQVDEKIGEYFSLVPKTPLEIKPYEEYREKFEAGGSYNSGAPDGSRPGTFYFNAYDLPSRLTTGNVTLYLHEGAPGHHFQISLAQENTDLPAFMRFGGNTAYVEGWALYSETLGYEMGFFDDPWNRYGTLQDEQLRAMRLVVDTGLHAKGWTREQAIDFMLENSGMTRTEVVAEVERYIAIPSQALAYKVGAIKIQELRKRAEDQLGEDFDIREFHAEVLDTGSLPMPVLENKIDRWIASKAS
ncbi:DUF885 domain-containing protein [Qipengyuania citrea]|jgi:uncharacterized protein (DUF885 family)|uniref:DUF885 domain-containing protein n=1 Tax=Qipengyuania citrea TaxID=225971 RepID=UPI000C351BDC|nr:DUF885 domain-containing protein [Qipengyuania citrea]MAC31028.1 DUF885 domain-containing protein [Erythrobacter sp.]MCZ4264656.1 DUF885 domain-containing protein [Erythrobacter sp. G21629-S1]MCD1589839.1 DUF885 domain-containing protein [Qipengyuania citrea]HBM71971.1 DUF885 domain-containing protein [Erythrobacter sp.]HBQ52858.1 DUF885 domain-containing protein [Erythrobacter sp.]|tara:strand:- start:573 stop:2396 length:1824 start_codon:yes stop_codon:yes gene_type:complete